MFVDSIISILIAMLCGGSGVVLISEGPVGMMIGFLVSFMVLLVSHAMGKKAIDEKLKNINLPLPIRRMALSGSLLHIEGPNLGLSDTLKNNPVAKLFSDGDDDEEQTPDSNATNARHLLPRIRFSDGDEISERRLRTIRSRILASYEKLIDNADNEDLVALNARMSHDISDQIERRLKELAEQVEIPL